MVTVKRKRGVEDDETQECNIRRTLLDSVDGIYKADPSFNKVSNRTMQRYMQKDLHKEFGQQTCKLDMCEKCSLWDRRISVKVAKWSFIVFMYTYIYIYV